MSGGYARGDRLPRRGRRGAPTVAARAASLDPRRLRNRTRRWCRGGALSGLVAAGIVASGCATLGPASIKNGRAAYNEAIVATNNQQVLAMIVQTRYGEPSGLLAVSSVTANLHARATVGSEFGIGPDSNYQGNITPLSAGIAYEENPTISYAPVQGEKYLRQFLSPLPLDLTVLLLGALGDSPQALTLLCKSINGVRNPGFLADPSVTADPRFERLADLLARMKRSDRLAWVEHPAERPGERSSFALVLGGEGATYEQQVTELHELLGLAVPRTIGPTITLPVTSAPGGPGASGIRLGTRSLWELFGIAASAVELPEEHGRAGLAPPLPPTGAAGLDLHIRVTRWRPWSAMVATERQGWWYFIDDADAPTKTAFRLLETLLSARMADAVERSPAPVLTVPVSR